LIVKSSNNFEEILKYINEKLCFIQYQKYPKHWKKQIEIFDKKLIQYDLSENDETYTKIKNKFLDSIENANILKITLFMNYYLWQSFQIGVD